jgi:hypothetical protein
VQQIIAQLPPNAQLFKKVKEIAAAWKLLMNALLPRF